MARWIMATLLAGLAWQVQADVYRWVDPATGKTIVSDQAPPGSYRRLSRVRDDGEADGPTSYAVKLAAEKYPVTLYTNAACVAECKAARDLLNGRGVPFTENMLQKPEEFEALKVLSGNTFFPTAKIGSQVLQGFQAEAWNNLLDLAGYPATAPLGSKPVGGIPAAK